MLELPARILSKLRGLIWTERGPSASGQQRIKVRRTSSALLIVVGAGMIAAALTTNDGRAMQDEPSPPAGPAVQGDNAPGAVANDPPPVRAPSTQSLAQPTGDSLVVNVTRSFPFVWPAEGPLTSEMGPWHTLGIDIGLAYEEDSLIRVSASGTVMFAGGEVWETYGHHVIIDHGGGMETLYGHLYEVFVEEDDFVEQGQLLGFGGDTGISDGKHLHFEVRHGNALIDPEHVLPPFGEDQPEPLTADCGTEAIVVDSGAPLVVDFAAALGAGASLSKAAVENAIVSPGALPVAATIESSTSVLFASTPTVTGTGADDEYRLVVTAGGGADEVELACTILVRTRTVSPSYYVRPTSTPTPPPPSATPIPPTATSTPTPTPTPTPTKTPFARR